MVTANSSGAWSKTLTDVSEGSHTYTARARDAAGNTSGRSNARTVIVDTIKPKVTVVAPANGKTGVSAATNVTATFSEAMNPATLNKTTVKLVKKGATTPVKATVTYNATTNKVTLDPSANLASKAVYTATITTGTKDRAGNALAANKDWKFTVR